MPQDFDVPPHGQSVARPPGLQPLTHHARTTDAAGLQFGPAPAHGLQQKRAQQITGGFSGHHGPGPRPVNRLHGTARSSPRSSTWSTRPPPHCASAAGSARKAPRGRGQKVEHQPHVRLGQWVVRPTVKQALDALARLLEGQAFAVQQAVDLLDLRDAFP